MLLGPAGAGRRVVTGSSDPEDVHRHGAGAGVAPPGHLVGQTDHPVRERPDSGPRAPARRDHDRRRRPPPAPRATPVRGRGRAGPSASAAIRRRAARRAPARRSVPHPIQIGTGAGGSGVMPASSTTSDVPTWPTLGSVQSRRSSGICSSIRAACSGSRSRAPGTPRRSTRCPPRDGSGPGARRASVATCFATNAVWRCGNTSTSVTNSSSARAGEVGEQHERLEERVAASRSDRSTRGACYVGAEDVVVHEQVVVAGVLEALDEDDELVGIDPENSACGKMAPSRIVAPL